MHACMYRVACARVLGRKTRDQPRNADQDTLRPGMYIRHDNARVSCRTRNASIKGIKERKNQFCSPGEQGPTGRWAFKQAILTPILRASSGREGHRRVLFYPKLACIEIEVNYPVSCPVTCCQKILSPPPPPKMNRQCPE